MSSIQPVLEIPKRSSLTAQTVIAIRKGIAAKVWNEFLPGERRLSELLQVSRPTVRAALHLIEKEGLLEIHQGKRNRIPPNRIHPRSVSPKRLVGLVVSEPFSHIAQTAYQGISAMRAQLAESGFGTEVIVCPVHGPRAQQHKLEAFLRQNRVFCCALLSVSKELQQWFSSHSIPALVLGSCHDSIQLPSLDIDHRSVCRHAASLLLSRGHRQIAFVVPDSNAAGDLASEQGFHEAVAQRKAGGAHAFIVRHNSNARNISAKLDLLFNSKHAPTALLIAKPQHVFIVIMYLLNRGLKVPEAISLVARDSDHTFEIVSPPITHYAVDSTSYFRRLSRLMLQMVNQGFLPPEQNFMFPKLVSGGTVREMT